MNAERQAAGCERDVSCIAEIAGALDSDCLLSGRLSEADGAYTISLKLIRTRGGDVVRQLTERIAARPCSPKRRRS